ncbi:MAG: hypothetical protein JWN31_1064 [Frankiales bacterium]|nr:hypothetical protein [Frankiales bacterium]
MTPVDHVKAELLGLHGLMSATPTADWDKQSACDGFRVRDVVGHLVSGGRVRLPTALVELAKHGGRINAAAWTASKREALRSREQLLDGLTAAAENPRRRGISRLQPVPVMFVDVVTRHEDIRWGLGARRMMAEPLAHDVLRTAVSLKGFGTWGTAERANGVSLHATDVDWKWGQGPEIFGTADALLLALGGRSVALAELSGEGLSRW